MTVYIQRGLTTNKLDKRELEKGFIETLNNMLTIIPHGEDIADYKRNKALYFISGEFKPNDNGTYIRNDNNLLYRDFAVLDIENTGKTNEELTSIFNNVLASYNFAYYPSISHTQEKPRYRVVIELDKKANKEEYKATVKELYKLLGINGDLSASVFSQLQGLPVCLAENASDYKVTCNTKGKAYKVAQAKKEIKIISNIAENINDNDFLDVFTLFLEAEKPNLEKDYNNSLAVIMSIAKSVLQNQINYETGLLACELLAYDNEKYKKENPNKLNREIKNGLENITTPYDIFTRMKKAGSKIFYEVNLLTNQIPTSENELFYRLQKEGNKWREEHKKTNKTGEITVPVMDFNAIAHVIIKNVKMCLIGENEEIANIYVYRFDEGIYKQSSLYIEKLITIIDNRFNPLKYQQVHKYIKTKLKHVRKLDNAHLIAVNNGIFNLKTQQLEPFSPDYIITSKIATNYNKDAKNPINYFDVDKWIMSIANNDKGIYTLLWQVINEAINPNYTRRKIGVMLGDGKNGKGTYQELLINLIGASNVSNLKPPQFATQFEMSQLVGKTCNIGDDISNKRLDEIDNIKTIASGDYITINRKNKEPISESLKLFLLFSANEIPRISEKTQAVLDRFLIIPFNADFHGEKEDRTIKDEKVRNKQVLEYVLNKALSLKFEHFSECTATVEALEEYKNDNDTIYSYINDEYIPKGLHELKAVPIFYITHDYNIYCENFRVTPRQRIGKHFTKQLNLITKRKYTLKKRSMSREEKKEILQQVVNALPFLKNRNVQLLIKNK